MRIPALALCFLFVLRVGVSPNADDVDAGRKQLNDLIAEYWEYNLKQNPVFASIIGDKRYNDQLGSYSEKAILEDQARKKAFLKRFEAIDTTGFPRQDKLNRELEVVDLRNDIEETDLKPWEMPVSQVSGFQHRGSATGVNPVVRDGEGLRRLHRAPRADAARLRRKC